MRAFDQINVIPFIDIMLVLLTIVLTTASFVSQGLIEVTLPETETAEAATPTDEKIIELSINSRQQIFFTDQLVTEAELEQRLKTLNKESVIVLRVDESVRFKHFVFIVDMLKKYQLEKLSILTRKHTQ
ncbi:MAG TPA: TonB system transport protein ExbD [Thiothrix sp.]|nr:TonB system transport protein ExbD [Thiothrix sp.]